MMSGLIKRGPASAAGLMAVREQQLRREISERDAIIASQNAQIRALRQQVANAHARARRREREPA